MTRSNRRKQADPTKWRARIGAAGLAAGLAAVLVTAPHVLAQAGQAQADPKYDGKAAVEQSKTLFNKVPTVSSVPHDFTGIWRGINPRGQQEGGGNCGSLKDHYGNPRELCEFPVDKLEPYMNGRMERPIVWRRSTVG